MKIEICNEEKYHDLFNDGNYSFLQSWEWGETKKPTWDPLRLQINKLPLTILTRQIPFSNNKIGYIPRVFENETENLTDTLESLVKFLSTEFDLSHIDIDTEITNFMKLESFTSLGFINSGDQIQPNDTSLIDISGTSEDIFSKFKSSTRNKIRKPEKEGCTTTIFKDGDEGIERFWDVMKSVIQNTDYVAHEKDYFVNVWQKMSKSGMANIIIASKDNKDFGTYFCTKNHNSIYELYGGINKFGRSIRGAGYFLKWKSIEYANKSNLKIYDQWGIAPKSNDDYDKNHQLYHISKFKKEFNGVDTKFLPKLTYIFNKKSYQIFKLGKTLNGMKIWLNKKTR